jgi:uncharacterized protein
MMVSMCLNTNGHDMDHEKHNDSDLIKIKTIDASGDLQIIHGYGDNGFRISGTRWAGSVIVAPRRSALWSPPPEDSLTAATFLPLFQDVMPPLLVLGVGAAPMQPLSGLANDLKQHGVALEVMSTPAACRTWNVLISEGRDAVAALYAVA